MKVSDNLREDIRQLGTDYEEWTLNIDISKYADPKLEGYYPVLSWEPNQFCPRDAMVKFQFYS